MKPKTFAETARHFAESYDVDNLNSGAVQVNDSEEGDIVTTKLLTNPSISAVI